MEKEWQEEELIDLREGGDLHFNSRTKETWIGRRYILSLLLGLCYITSLFIKYDLLRWALSSAMLSEGSGAEELACPQVDPIPPSKHSHLAFELDLQFYSPIYRLHAYESLGGAIRIPSVLISSHMLAL